MLWHPCPCTYWSVVPAMHVIPLSASILLQADRRAEPSGQPGALQCPTLSRSTPTLLLSPVPPTPPPVRHWCIQPSVTGGIFLPRPKSGVSSTGKAASHAPSKGTTGRRTAATDSTQVLLDRVARLESKIERERAKRQQVKARCLLSHHGACACFDCGYFSVVGVYTTCAPEHCVSFVVGRRQGGGPSLGAQADGSPVLT
jgi:hypothetical protein